MIRNVEIARGVNTRTTLSKTVDKEFQYHPKNRSGPGDALTPHRVQGRNLCFGRSRSDVVMAAWLKLPMCRMSMRGEMSVERALFHDDPPRLAADARAGLARARPRPILKREPAVWAERHEPFFWWAFFWPSRGLRGGFQPKHKNLCEHRCHPLA